MSDLSSIGDAQLRRVLLAALEQTRASACITSAQVDEPGPEIVYVNPAYCRMTGRRPEEVLGRTPRLMQGPLTDRRVLDDVRLALTNGQPFSGETVNYRKDGSPFLINWQIDPVFDGNGVLTHFIATQQDVTEARRRERLVEAERRIDRATNDVLAAPIADEVAALHRLAGLVVAAVADQMWHGVVRVQVVSSTGARAEVRSHPGDTTEPPAGEMAEMMTSPGEHRGGDDGRHWVAHAFDDARSGMAGVLAVTELDEHQLAFIDAEGLAAAAIRARASFAALAEYERQRRTAVELQYDLLPGGPLVAAGLEIATGYRPGSAHVAVGGDWYDIVDLGERGVVFLVGDVAGSGVRAAAAMGRLRLLAHVLLREAPTVAGAMASMDRACVLDDVFATLLAVAVEPATRRLEICSAGHLAPLVRRVARAQYISIRPGPPLGTGTSLGYRAVEAVLAAGETVVMVTDGLIERRGEVIDVGLARFAETVRSGPGDPQALCDLLLNDGADASSDDRAALAFRLAPDAG